MPYPRIPILAAEQPACAGAESFALIVLGDAMLPEFAEGEVIIVEPGAPAADGSFVLARVGGEWMLRQLRRAGDGWLLAALDSACPGHAIADLSAVRGVVTQKAMPGRRRAGKRYVD
ncbi:MAG: S24 family peptidase [Bacteroidota bacterium]